MSDIRTFVRLKDGVKITVDANFLTKSMMAKLGSIQPVEVPKAIKAKQNEGTKRNNK